MNREDQITTTVNAVKNRMSNLKASKQFGVPTSPFQFRMGHRLESLDLVLVFISQNKKKTVLLE